MTQLLRAGVAGAGSFGGHHARKYASLDGVELTAVYDPDISRASALADSLGAVGVDHLDALFERIDILTVASPAHTHRGVVMAALAAGKPVYVEKPIATALDDAERMIEAAERAGLVLACGFQERVVSRAMGLLDLPQRPLSLTAVRRGPWSPRNTDVTCVLDLMIHDIDLALSLNPAEPVAVEARGKIQQGPLLDEVTCEVRLADGAVLSLEASRMAEARERKMRIVYPSGEVEIDFITRAFRNTTPFALNEAFIDTPAGRDPLGVSVAAFIAAVRGEAPRPAATGAEAALALGLALAIEEAAAL